MAFGTKYDVSIGENGHAWLEKSSLDVHNECAVIKDIVEHRKEQTGRHPKRVLVDQTYRTRENRAHCKERSTEMPGRKPSRPPKEGK